MSSPSSDLSVRGNVRFQCSLETLLAIGQEHARLVKPDKSAPGAGGPVAAQLVDLSLGGAGLQSPLFFPRLCRLTMSLTPPGSIDPLTLDLRVHRVTMLNRSPMYYIGAGFDSLTPEQSQSILDILAHLKAAGATLVPEPPRA